MDRIGYDRGDLCLLDGSILDTCHLCLLDGACIVCVKSCHSMPCHVRMWSTVLLHSGHDICLSVMLAGWYVYDLGTADSY